jgi:hypothetical protein
MRRQPESSTFPLSDILISMFFFFAHLSFPSLFLSLSLILIKQERQSSDAMVLPFFFLAQKKGKKRRK